MFWIKIIFLIIAALITLVYAIYHICMAVMLKRAEKPGREWIFLTHEAYECSRRGEYQKSIGLAERAIQLNPRASEAWCLIGNAYEFLGDEAEQSGDYGEVAEYHKKATEAWNKAKEINPKIIIPGYHQ